MNIDLGFYTGFHGFLLNNGAKATADFLHSHNISSAEICVSAGSSSRPVFPTLEDAEAVRRDLGDIKMFCFSAYGNLFTDDGDKTLNDLIYYVSVAKILGAKYFHHTIYPPLTINENSPTFDEVFAKVLPGVIKVARVANEQGLVPVYEPQGCYFSTVDALRRLLYAVRAEGLNAAIVLDLGNPFFSDTDPYDILKAFESDIVHVHIKDYKYITEAPSDKPKSMHVYKVDSGRMFIETIPGSGDVSVERCLRALKEMGYSGVYSSETSTGSAINDYIATREYLERVDI